MSPDELYRSLEYIPQNLIEHQKTVSQVAYILAVNLEKAGVKINPDLTLAVALTHDLGNLAKYRLDSLKRNTWMKNEETLKHWRKKQEEFIKKYSSDPDKATLSLVKKANLHPKVIKLLGKLDADNALMDLTNNDFEIPIVFYADLRVAPFGLVSITQRIKDGIKRYKDHPTEKRTTKHFEKLENTARKVEDFIKNKLGKHPDFSLNSENLKNAEKIINSFSIPTKNDKI